MIWTPPLDELPFLPTLTCATSDFDVTLMVMPYFSWLLKSNGKHQVIKFLLLSKHLYLTFLCDFKRWRNYLGVDTYALIPPNSKLEAEVFVFETSPPCS